MSTALENDEAATRFFEAHIEEAKHLVPSENLLVFQVKEGWTPLCRFLEVEEPKVPFPRINDTAKMTFMRRVIAVLSWLVVVVIPCLLAVYAVIFPQGAYQAGVIILGLFLAIILSKTIFERMLMSHCEQATQAT